MSEFIYLLNISYQYVTLFIGWLHWVGSHHMANALFKSATFSAAKCSCFHIHWVESFFFHAILEWEITLVQHAIFIGALVFFNMVYPFLLEQTHTHTHMCECVCIRTYTVNSQSNNHPHIHKIHVQCIHRRARTYDITRKSWCDLKALNVSSVVTNIDVNKCKIER